MTIDIQQQNLMEMSAIYLQKDEVLLGRQVAFDMSNVSLDMRNTTYFDAEINWKGESIYTRSQCLNKLLDFYSVLEIGFLTGFIPSVNDYDYNNIVSSPKEGNIQNYCFIRYKSMIPLDLFKRFKGGSGYDELVADNKTISIVYNFMSVLDYIEDHISISHLLSHDENSLDTLFENLQQIEHILFDDLPLKEQQMVTGYFAYLELLPMIAELIQESNAYESVKRAITNYFTKLIDENETPIKYVLDQTYNLFEHFYSDQISKENMERVNEFNKCLVILRRALLESSALIPA